MSTASRFMELFKGADASHGTYDVEEKGSSAKLEIKKSARTLREPVTLEHWRLHLSGFRPLGIVPIREDHTCVWGAVDVDVYDLNIQELSKLLADNKVPCIVCRTKSGGAHVYLFFSEPIQASEVIPRLRDLAALIGQGSAEIFPKQEKVLTERGDLGSWLNMPYYGGDKTTRYAVRPDGRGMSEDSFLDMAEGIRLSKVKLMELNLRKRVEGFENGPPCLEQLVAKGISEHRNNALLNLGVLAKKMYPDGWEPVLEEWNQKHCKPPLAAAEVTSAIRSLRKKEYFYRCNDQPICAVCTVALCKTRAYGVGAGGEASILETARILQTDPPVFFVDLKEGGTVEVSASQLLSSHEFQVATLVQLRKVIPEIPRQVWTRNVQEIISTAENMSAPPESGVKGKFMELFEQFLVDKHRAESKEEILLGKPWFDEETNIVYFRLRDLEAAMERARFSTGERSGTLRTWMTKRIIDMNGKTEPLDIRGRLTNVWSISAANFTWSELRHDLPMHDEDPI